MHKHKLERTFIELSSIAQKKLKEREIFPESRSLFTIDVAPFTPIRTLPMPLHRHSRNLEYNALIQSLSPPNSTP